MRLTAIDHRKSAIMPFECKEHIGAGKNDRIGALVLAEFSYC